MLVAMNTLKFGIGDNMDTSLCDTWAIEQIPDGLQLYRFGSTILPWIENPHDIDYVALLSVEQYDTLGEYRPRYCDNNPTRHIILRKDWDVWAIIAYEFHYAVPIYINIGELPIFDIYNPEIKRWILNSILRLHGRIHRSKVWYHAYTNLAFWKNGNWQLTEEDIARINRLHDHCGTEEDFVILQQMLEKELEKPEVYI